MSPKNKGKFRKDKDLTPPTEELKTLWEKGFETLRPHAFKIGAVVGGLVVVLAGFSAWSWYEGRRETRATREVTDLLTQAEGRVNDGLTPGEQPVDEDEAKPYKSYKERDETALKTAAQLEDKYGSAKAAKQALLVKAGLLYDLGRYDEAVAAYEKYTGSLDYLAKEGIGYAKEAKALAQTDAKAREAGLDEALKAFQAVQPDEKGAHGDLVLYHQARILALKGDKAKAVDSYKKALEKNPSLQLQQEINDRLALLEESK